MTDVSDILPVAKFALSGAEGEVGIHQDTCL
jgi:hypothetical protein